MDDEKETNPAWAMIGFSRVSGVRRLHGVDWPQGHFIRLRVCEGARRRDLSHDWYFDGGTIMEIDMSEVQFARLISSLNMGTGTPATFAVRPEPGARLIRPPEVPPRKRTSDLFRDEVKERTDRAGETLAKAINAAEALLEGGRFNKGNVSNLLGQMQAAQQDLRANIKFVIESADEAIQDSAERAKSEIEAYAGHVALVVAAGAFADGSVDREKLVEKMKLQIAPPETKE